MVIKTLSEHLVMATPTSSLRPPVAHFRGKAELFCPQEPTFPKWILKHTCHKLHTHQLDDRLGYTMLVKAPAMPAPPRPDFEGSYFGTAAGAGFTPLTRDLHLPKTTRYLPAALDEGHKPALRALSNRRHLNPAGIPPSPPLPAAEKP